MKNKGNLVLMAGMIAGLALVSVIGVIIPRVVDEVLQPPKSALFKIGKVDSDQPHCSAFAISPTVALTAKHCVEEPDPNQHPMEMMMRGPRMIPITSVKIYEEGQTASLGDTAMSVPPKHSQNDIAALRGDFSDRYQLPQNSYDFSVFINKEDEYETCGFPYMTPESVCTPMKVIANYGPMMRAMGFVIYGQSGGLVYNKTRKLAVGVISSMDDGSILFNPLVAIKELFNLSQEDVTPLRVK